MATLNEILEQLEGDDELQKLAEGDMGQHKAMADVDAAAEYGAATQPADAAANVPSASPTTGAGVAGEVAGQATSSEVAGSLGDSVEDQKVKLKEQLMEQAGKQHEAKAMAEYDEMPGAATEPVKGEMVELGGAVSDAPMAAMGDKMAEARVEYLMELGEQKEAELVQEKLAQDNYVLGQIFGHGVKDYMEGRDPAMQKEASILDTLSSHTEEEIDQALAQLTDEETEKIATALEEKGEFDKLASKFYHLGREYGRGVKESQEG